MEEVALEFQDQGKMNHLWRDQIGFTVWTLWNLWNQPLQPGFRFPEGDMQVCLKLLRVYLLRLLQKHTVSIFTCSQGVIIPWEGKTTQVLLPASPGVYSWIHMRSTIVKNHASHLPLVTRLLWKHKEQSSKYAGPWGPCFVYNSLTLSFSILPFWSNFFLPRYYL